MSAHADRSDGLLLAALTAVGGAGVVVWLTGEIAALLSQGRWPAVPAGAAVTILARLPATLGSPARAWPPPVRNQLPNSPGWYLVAGAISLAGVVGAVGLVLAAVRVGRASDLGAGPKATSLVHPRHRRSRRYRGGATAVAGGARKGLRRVHPGGLALRRSQGGLLGTDAGAGAYWAARRDVKSLRISRPPGDRIVLGQVGHSLVATEARHSVLVLGPTQSGKTTALAIPALLEWNGPVIATSVKDDLVAATRDYRARLGETWVFDPTAAVRDGTRSQWSPLAEASTWSGAQRVAQAMVDAAPAQAGLSDGAFWYQASAKLLAPLLLAAARGGRAMADVVRWTNRQETEEVQLVLEQEGEIDAVAAVEAGRNRDERIRSSVYTTLETVLAPYEDPVVAASTAFSEIDPATLLAGRHTLYLCGPAHEQTRVQGVFSALITAFVHAAVRRCEARGPLDPPLLLVLDEAANIAPIKDLDTLASTAAGMGIQLMTVCQDLAQLAGRYGNERARTIANNHRAKVALSGIADIGTLDTLSGLAGEAAVREQTVTADLRDGRRSTSTSISYRRLVPADELRRIPPGQGLLIYGHLPPARLVLRPWYRDRELRRRVTASEPSTGSA